VVGTQTVPRALGLGWALDLMLTGRAIDARLALRIGMVGSVVAPGRLRSEAARLARRLAKIDEELLFRVKTLVARGSDLPLAAALDWERVLGEGPKP
jgi:enoyl-CoA hydratase/carnithine racemase